MGFSKKEAPNCDWCRFKKNCFYDLLEDKTSKKAWKDMRVANRFKPGETIFYEGEKPIGAYVVCSGQVKIYKASTTGQQLLTRIESPGDLLGHISWLSGWNYAGSAQTMEESVVSMVGEAEMTSFLTQHPKACFTLLKEVSRDVRRGEARARDIAFKPARSRLAGALLRAADGPDAGAKPVCPLKRKELAEMSGLTVETTVRLLKDLETRGLIRRGEKDIRILDRNKLMAISGHFS